MGQQVKTAFTRLLVLTLSIFILSQGSIPNSFEFGKKPFLFAQNNFSESFFMGLMEWLYQEHLEIEIGNNPLTSDSQDQPEQDSDEEDSEENKKEGAKDLAPKYDLNLLFLHASFSRYKYGSITYPFIAIFSPPPEIA